MGFPPPRTHTHIHIHIHTHAHTFTRTHTLTGVIPEYMATEAALLGAAVAKSFGPDAPGVSSGPFPPAKCSSLNIILTAPASATPFDTVVIMEGLEGGQLLTGYALDVSVGGKPWQELPVWGQSIGHKIIQPLTPGVSAGSRVRLRCTGGVDGDDTKVSIRRFGLHRMHPPPPPPPKPLSLRSYLKQNKTGGGVDHAPCAARGGGGCGVYLGAGYKLLRAEATVWSGPSTSGAQKRVHLIYSTALDDNSISDGTPTFSPPGYTDESATGEVFYVYANPGAGLLPLDVFLNEGMREHWVLADHQSRAEAQARGYQWVGTLGYVGAPDRTYDSPLS